MKNLSPPRSDPQRYGRSLGSKPAGGADTAAGSPRFWIRMAVALGVAAAVFLAVGALEVASSGRVWDNDWLMGGLILVVLAGALSMRAATLRATPTRPSESPSPPPSESPSPPPAPKPSLEAASNTTAPGESAV